MGLERIWTPWRMEYILEPKDEGCLFCRVLAETSRDRENLLLLRLPSAFIMLNRYPYNTGHLMVVPHRHAETLTGLEVGERQELMEAVARAEEALGAAYRPEGLNIGINIGACAGAGVVGHLHVHLVPRWTGDTSYMPVLGEVKVMPESLDATFERLRRVL